MVKWLGNYSTNSRNVAGNVTTNEQPPTARNNYVTIQASFPIYVFFFFDQREILLVMPIKGLHHCGLYLVLGND